VLNSESRWVESELENQDRENNINNGHGQRELINVSAGNLQMQMTHWKKSRRKLWKWSQS